MAVVGTLLRVEVQDLPLAIREVGFVIENLPSGNRGCHDGADVECLLGLALAGGSAEIAQRADGRVAHPYYLRRHRVLVRCLDEYGGPNRMKVLQGYS